jgi:hypothetical protein
MIGRTSQSIAQVAAWLWSCVGLHWPEKIVGSCILLFWVMVPYFWFQHHHQGVRCVVEPGWFDRLVPFHPMWGIPYLFLYPMALLATLCLTDHLALRRWWVVNGLMPLPAWTCFYFVQTEYPRPTGGPWPWPYSAIVEVDAPLNVTPCLHSAYALLAAFLLAQTLRVCRPAWAGMWAVTLLVLVSIVGTRQHRVVDVLLGSLLAAVAWAWFRWTCGHARQSAQTTGQNQGRGPPNSPALKKN